MGEQQAKRPARLEGLVALAEEGGQGKPRRVTLKFIRESADGQTAVTDVVLSLSQAHRLAHFFCWVAREATRGGRRKLLRQRHQNRNKRQGTP